MVITLIYDLEKKKKMKLIKILYFCGIPWKISTEWELIKKFKTNIFKETFFLSFDFILYLMRNFLVNYSIKSLKKKKRKLKNYVI